MPRLEFPTATQREALARSNGICECHLIPYVFTTPCGLKLGPANTFFEHIICDGISKDNSLENCAVLTRNCWRFKTANYDQPTVAQAKRKFDRNNGIRDPWKKALPGGKRSDVKIKLNRTVVDRRTGAPVWPR